MFNLIKKLLNLSYYTSNIDDFLAEFDKTHSKLSASQRQEKAKYDRIFALRDNPNAPLREITIWDGF